MKNLRFLTVFIALFATLAISGCSSISSDVSSATKSLKHEAKKLERKQGNHDKKSKHTTRGASGGQLSLITEPNEGIAPITHALKNARGTIDLVMYENEDTTIDSELVADEHAGAHVRVLLNDGYYGGGFPQNKPAYTYFTSHGVPVHWTPAYFALTHQKTLVINNRAYILTFNFTPQYYVSSRDFGIIDTNKADVSAIKTAFNDDWTKHKVTAPTGHDLVWSPGSEQAQANLINSAHGWLDVYNEEMDDTPIEQALEAAAHRGVNVEVTMTASSSWDSAFSQLAQAGVHIRLYAADAKLYIHAKMILDPQKVFLGSENFSASSLKYNRELGLIFSTPAIRRSLQKTFNSDYKNATPFSS